MTQKKYKQKKIKYSIQSILLLVAFTTISCDQGIIEPIIKEEESFLIGDFEFLNLTPTSSSILISWSEAENATMYDILVNDTVGVTSIQTNSFLLNRLSPNTLYKISIRAYDKNLNTRMINTKVSTTHLPVTNEIAAFDFGAYDHQKINITNCIVTGDNHYVILADVIKNTIAYKMVMKTDKNFNIIWRNYFLGGSFDYTNPMGGQEIKECFDGGFLVISKFFNFRLTTNGVLLYQHRYDSSITADQIDNAIEIPNGNILTVGPIYQIFNSKFEKIWESSSGFRNVSDVIRNKNGNFMVFGHANSITDVANYNIRLTEITQKGEVVHLTNYNFSSYSTSKLILRSKNDDGYYLLSQSLINYSYLSELCVTRTNDIGKEQWTLKTYSILNNKALTLLSARVLPDNSLLCLDYNFIIEISADGKISRDIRLNNINQPFFLDKDEHGRYIVLTREGYIYKLLL